jgi:hypothetical protein
LPLLFAVSEVCSASRATVPGYLAGRGVVRTIGVL